MIAFPKQMAIITNFYRYFYTRLKKRVRCPFDNLLLRFSDKEIVAMNYTKTSGNKYLSY